MPDDDQENLPAVVGVDMGRTPSETALAMVQRGLGHVDYHHLLEFGTLRDANPRPFYSGGLVPRTCPVIAPDCGERVVRRPDRHSVTTNQLEAAQTTINVTVILDELAAGFVSVAEQVRTLAEDMRRLHERLTRQLLLGEVRGHAVGGILDRVHHPPPRQLEVAPKYPPALLEDFVHDGWVLQVLASRKAVRRHGTVVGNCLGSTEQSKDHFDAVRNGTLGAIIGMIGSCGAAATASVSRSFDRFYCELSDHDQRSGDLQAIGEALAAFAAFAQKELGLRETTAIALSMPVALTRVRALRQQLFPIRRRTRAEPPEAPPAR